MKLYGAQINRLVNWNYMPRTLIFFYAIFKAIPSGQKRNYQLQHSVLLANCVLCCRYDGGVVVETTRKQIQYYLIKKLYNTALRQ